MKFYHRYLLGKIIKKELTSIKINPDVLDDVDMLQDLVLTAVNEALRKADELTANEMKKFNLPF